MNSTKKREIGVGNNLYGIPIDDILTPEQLESMKKNPPSSKRRKLRAERKRRKKERRSFKNIKLPQLQLTNNVKYAILAALVIIVFLSIFKNPIAVRIAPKLYAAEAFEDSVKRVEKELENTVKGVFGFKVFDVNNLTVTAGGEIDNDSSNTMNNLAMNLQAGYSKKNKTASGAWQYLHRDEEFASASMYLNDEEIGLNIPQIFAEYWISPSGTFGKKWNESGLRQALYAEPIGESADLSFSNIFGGRRLLSDKGMKKAAQLTEKLFDSSDAAYDGKTEIAVNEKSKLARQIKFTFSHDAIARYLIGMMRLIEEDEESAEILSYLGKTEQLSAYFEDVEGRLTDSIKIKEVYLEAAEYKGAVRSVQLNAVYEENGSPNTITCILTSESLKSVTDAIGLQFNYQSFDKSFSYNISSKGNHTSEGKLFTDNTAIEVVSDGYTYRFNSELSLDFKEGTVTGSALGEDKYSSKSISYSGACKNKKGIELSLDNIQATVTGNIPRSLSGNGHIKLEPSLTMPKLNTSNKKMILDYTKAEAESYIARLEETDSVKKLLEKVNSIFKK